MTFEDGHCKELQEFIERPMRFIKQARPRVASAVSDSKSTPLDQKRSESSNKKQNKLHVKACNLLKGDSNSGVFL